MSWRTCVVFAPASTGRKFAEHPRRAGRGVPGRRVDGVGGARSLATGLRVGKPQASVLLENTPARLGRCECHASLRPTQRRHRLHAFGARSYRRSRSAIRRGQQGALVVASFVGRSRISSSHARAWSSAMFFVTGKSSSYLTLGISAGLNYRGHDTIVASSGARTHHGGDKRERRRAATRAAAGRTI